MQGLFYSSPEQQDNRGERDCDDSFGCGGDIDCLSVYDINQAEGNGYNSWTPINRYEHRDKNGRNQEHTDDKGETAYPNTTKTCLICCIERGTLFPGPFFSSLKSFLYDNYEVKIDHPISKLSIQSSTVNKSLKQRSKLIMNLWTWTQNVLKRSLQHPEVTQF